MNLIEKKKSLRKLYYPVSQKVFDRNLVKTSRTEKIRESDNLTNFLSIIYLSRFAIFLLKLVGTPRIFIRSVNLTALSAACLKTLLIPQDQTPVDQARQALP